MKISEKEKEDILKSLASRKTPQLKSESEPIVLAQKPKEGTFITSRGVKLPEWRSAKSLWLVYLYKFRSYQVHKDTISDFVRNLKKIGRDQQQKVANGYHVLFDIKNPKPTFLYKILKREGRLSAKCWEELKIVYDNRCVNCGALENHHHPRFRDTIVVLQKGHIDPNKPEVLENIIPQCQICNQTYKDNFVYDENGYIKAINNENFVL
ncbi:14319_t:CDS:2, partial [Cetraspora pellucida]